MALLNDPILHARSKHTDIHYHFVRDRIARGELAFVYIPTATMVADTFTKALALDAFQRCRSRMGLHGLRGVICCSVKCCLRLLLWFEMPSQTTGLSR
eukprot:26863-Chlamydomonas_euryale.AAC.1